MTVAEPKQLYYFQKQWQIAPKKEPGFQNNNPAYDHKTAHVCEQREPARTDGSPTSPNPQLKQAVDQKIQGIYSALGALSGRAGLSNREVDFYGCSMVGTT